MKDIKALLKKGTLKGQEVGELLLEDFIHGMTHSGKGLLSVAERKEILNRLSRDQKDVMIYNKYVCLISVLTRLLSWTWWGFLEAKHRLHLVYSINQENRVKKKFEKALKKYADNETVKIEVGNLNLPFSRSANSSNGDEGRPGSIMEIATSYLREAYAGYYALTLFSKRSGKPELVSFLSELRRVRRVWLTFA